MRTDDIEGARPKISIPILSKIRRPYHADGF